MSASEEELEEETTHLVVSFPNDERNDGKMSLEVVPRNWVVRQKGNWYCMYPGSKDYGKVSSYVKVNRTPDKNWQKHPMKIMSQCENLPRALRHLERAYTSKELETDIVDEDNPPKTPAISKAVANKLLDQIPQFNQKNSSQTIDKSVSDKGQTSKRNVDSISAKMSGNSGLSRNSFQYPVNEGHSSKSSMKDDSVNGSESSNRDSSVTKKKMLSKKTSRKKNVNDYVTDSSFEHTVPVQTSTPQKQKSPKKNSAFKINEEPQTQKAVKRRLDVPTGSSGMIATKKRKQIPTLEDVDKMIENCASFKDLAEIKKSLTLIAMDDYATKMTTMKRSLQYDSKEKHDNLLAKVVTSGPVANVKSLATIKLNLKVHLPIDDLDEFKAFDASLSQDEIVKQNFMDYLDIKVQMYSSVKETLSKVLGELITRNVQILYSGCGKQQKNIQKLNFSKTTLYTLLESTLIAKYKDETDKNILTKTSRWLAGAIDRAGGKLNRMKQAEKEAQK